MDKIIVTRKIPQPFIEQLEALGQVEMWDSYFSSSLITSFKSLKV
jgi:glyoxylate reductase